MRWEEEEKLLCHSFLNLKETVECTSTQNQGAAACSKKELPTFRITAPHCTYSGWRTSVPLESHDFHSNIFSKLTSWGRELSNNSSLECKLWWLSRRFPENFRHLEVRGLSGHTWTVKLQPFRLFPDIMPISVSQLRVITVRLIYCFFLASPRMHRQIITLKGKKSSN